jgi:hypothetical protein
MNIPDMKRFTENQWQILKKFALIGKSISRYDLKKELGVNNYLYQVFNIFVDEKVVKCDEDKSGNKNYTLTVDGFSWLILDPSLNINKLCQSNRNLIPLICGKWKYYISDKNIQKMAKKRLEYTAMRYIYDSKILFPLPSEYGYENTDPNYFTQQFYHPVNPVPDVDMSELLNYAVKDADLKNYIFKMLDGLMTSYDDNRSRIQMLKQYLNKQQIESTNLNSLSLPLGKPIDKNRMRKR